MKKIITLLLPLLLLVSCEKTSKKPHVFPAPPYVGQAVRYTNVYANADIDTDYSQQSEIVQFVSFTEGGTYLLCRKVEEPLTGGPGKVSKKYVKTYTAGTYTIVADNTYRLEGYGTVKKASTKVQADEELTFTPTAGQPFTIPCTVQNATVLDDLYRQWDVKSTRVKLDGDMKVAADFAGCDINEICAFLKENGLYDGEDFPAGQKVSLVDISGLNEITILYENGNVDHAKITSHNLSVIGYQWSAPGMGFGFENGEATVAYDADTCIFNIMGNVTHNGKTTEVSLTWALKEKKL